MTPDHPDKLDRICVVCGRADVLENHHPVGRARVPNATVPLCRRCHDQQSERQRQAGVDLEGASSDPVEDLWAFAVGFQSLLSASAAGIGCGVDVRAERAFVGLVREVIRSCSQLPDAVVGPDPIANAVRDGRRTRSRRRQLARVVASAAEAVSVPAAGEAVWSVIVAVAAVVDRFLGTNDRNEPFVQTLKSIAATTALPARLLELESHPRHADIGPILHSDHELLCELLEQSATVGDASAIPHSLQMLGARFRQRETAYLDIVTQLASANDSVAAAVVFEAFLDRRERT